MRLTGTPAGAIARRRGVRLVLLLVLLVGLAMSAASSAPARERSPSAAAQSCPDVAIFGVRGSGAAYLESELGMGHIVSVVAGLLHDRLPSSRSVISIGVPYQAINADWASLNGAGAGPYNNSVLGGAEMLVNGRRDVKFEGLGQLVFRCPHVDLVLMGHSQGAQVITEALTPANKSDLVVQRIRAVILFASPVRRVGASYDVGASNANGVLSDPDAQPGRIAASIPSFLWSDTRSYCLLHDPICAFTSEDFPTNLDVHGSYAESPYASAAANFALSRLGGKTPETVQTAFPIQIAAASVSVSARWVTWTLKTKGPVATGDEPCIHVQSLDPLGYVWLICGVGGFGVDTHSPLPVGGGYAGEAYVNRPNVKTVVTRIHHNALNIPVHGHVLVRWQAGHFSGTLSLP